MKNICKKLIGVLIIITLTNFNNIAFSQENSTTIRNVLESDMKAVINGYVIPSYVVDNNVVVNVDYLNYYGFEVIDNGEKDTLTIIYNPNKPMTPINENHSYIVVGRKISDAIKADRKIIIGDEEIQSFLIDDKITINLTSLKEFGEIIWKPNDRVLELTMHSVPEILEWKNVESLDLNPIFPTASKYINDNHDRNWGYMDINGNMLIEPKFARAYEFREGLAVVKDQENGKYGYINKLGAYVIEPRFDLAHPFSQGLAAVKYNDQFYYIDYYGNIIINNIQIDMDKVKSMVEINENVSISIGDCYQFGKDGYAEIAIYVLTKQNDFFTNSLRIPYLINREGEIFAPEINFLSIHNFSEGLAKFSSNKRVSQGYYKEGYLDKNGKEIEMKLEPYIHLTGSFFDDRASFRSDYTYKYGYIDKKGNVVIEPIFHNAGDFNHGMAKVEVLKDNKIFVGFINTNGEYIIEPKFELTPVTMMLGSGYDEIMQESLYPDEYLYTFNEGLAPFEFSGKYGYIDKDGKVIIDAKYKFAKNFVNGLAVVRTIDDKLVYIDKYGNFVGYYLRD